MEVVLLIKSTFLVRITFTKCNAVLELTGTCRNRKSPKIPKPVRTITVPLNLSMAFLNKSMHVMQK